MIQPQPDHSLTHLLLTGKNERRWREDRARAEQEQRDEEQMREMAELFREAQERERRYQRERQLEREHGGPPPSYFQATRPQAPLMRRASSTLPLYTPRPTSPPASSHSRPESHRPLSRPPSYGSRPSGWDTHRLL